MCRLGEVPACRPHHDCECLSTSWQCSRDPLQVFRSPQIPTCPRHEARHRPRLFPLAFHSPGLARQERRRCQPQVSGIRSALCQQTRENVGGRMKCMQTTTAQDLREGQFKREREKSEKLRGKRSTKQEHVRLKKSVRKRRIWDKVAVSQGYINKESLQSTNGKCTCPLTCHGLHCAPKPPPEGFNKSGQTSEGCPLKTNKDTITSAEPSAGTVWSPANGWLDFTFTERPQATLTEGIWSQIALHRHTGTTLSGMAGIKRDKCLVMNCRCTCQLFSFPRDSEESSLIYLRLQLIKGWNGI